jgi:hypothetical protein
MTLGLYKLQGKLAVPVDSIEEWYGSLSGKHVAVEEIGPFVISTVFLGIDHSFGSGLPILFETMIFTDGHSDDYQERCGTWEEAIDQHEAAVAHVIANLAGRD